MAKYPTDNAVAERFMRTFKEHEIEGKPFEDLVQEVSVSRFKSYINIVKLFIKSLNGKPNKKSLYKVI